MKKTLFVLIFAVLTFGFLKAEDVSGSILNEENFSGNNLPANKCIVEQFYIDGFDNIVKDVPAKFSVKSNDSILSSSIKEVVFDLYKKDSLIETFTGKEFNRIFSEPGVVKLNVSFKDESGCQYNMAKTINVYKTIALYIGDNEEDFNISFENIDGKNNVYFRKIILGEQNLFSEEYLEKKLSDNLYYFINSDKIIINSSFFLSTFDVIGKVSFDVLGKYYKLYNVDIKSKKFFVVSNINQNLLKRVATKYMGKQGIEKFYILNKANFLNFVSDLLNDVKVENLSYIKKFSLNLQEVSKYFFISYVVDYLIYNGFPSDLISLILTLAVAMLIISMLRQIIGFSVFGIYNPLLFSISMVVLGWKFSLLLLFVGFLATSIVRLFTKKIYLLYSAKTSFLIIIYFIFTLIILWIDNISGFGILDYKVFINSFIIFPIIFLIIVANKVFPENSSVFSLSWFISFLEFLFVSFSVYFLMIWNSFRYFLISYPEIIFLILILNIIVGRFTGLQILEYLRFMPLIKKTFDEEE